MRFRPTALHGVFLVDIDWKTDERGSFGHAWGSEELEERGLIGHFIQTNISITTAARTLRGLHYQLQPAAEAKIIRCSRGAIFDVVIDIRHDSPSRRRWQGFELRPEGYEAVYVPPGAAHGFMSLADDTEVVYSLSAPHVPELERGIRWNDPAFGIPWPLGGPRLISAKDRSWPDHAGA